MPLTLEPSKTGFEMFFKPWEIETFRALWKHPEGATSFTVWKETKEKTEISRASVINYLNAMVDEDILEYTETTGKGGHYRIYRLDMNESEFKQFLAQIMIDKLLIEYPAATQKAINEIK